MAGASTVADERGVQINGRDAGAGHAARRRGRGQDVETAAGFGVTMTVTPGQTVIVEGDPIEHCFRIISGALRMYKAIPDGRRQVIDFLTAGDSFGFLGQDRFAYTVEAITHTTMVRHPRPQFEAAIERSSTLARRMLDMACVELERAHWQMLLLGRKSADEKIASFLLGLAERAPGPRAGPIIHLPMSRQDMADYLGLTIETVSRTFSRLKREGLIALPSPQRVIVQRARALRALAEGGS